MLSRFCVVDAVQHGLEVGQELTGSFAGAPPIVPGDDTEGPERQYRGFLQGWGLGDQQSAAQLLREGGPVDGRHGTILCIANDGRRLVRPELDVPFAQPILAVHRDMSPMRGSRDSLNRFDSSVLEADDGAILRRGGGRRKVDEGLE